MKQHNYRGARSGGAGAASGGLTECYEFIQCLDTIASSMMASQNNPQRNVLTTEDYEAQPWHLCQGGQSLVEEFLRITDEVECELIDLFVPVRDPRFVLSELSKPTIIELNTEILACEICHNFCKETTTVKECAHRFCNDCIQKWIRKGNTACPVCPGVKVPSRRVLRHNLDLDVIIDKLIPDDRECRRILKKKATPEEEEEEEEEEDAEEEDDDDMADSVAEESDSDEVVDESESDSDDEEMESEESEEERNTRRRASAAAQRPQPLLEAAPCGGPSMLVKSAYGQNLDELYADDMGYLEIFLVCLNSNLPPAVCSMARELSKRPMKLPVGATTRDAAMILAEKLVRDVLGPFDVHSIITDLSFVRDGDIWPAISQIPLSEVCRQVTESRGPIALRYLLSDRLFSLCERIETSY